jgi:hypothetical protein
MLLDSQRKTLLIYFILHKLPEVILMKILKVDFGPFIEFVETATSHRPILGYSYGIDYARYFNKVQIGIYLQENVRGQRSGFAYNYSQFLPADTLKGYGGLNYIFKIKTIGLGLNLGYNLTNQSDYSSGIKLSFGLDIFETSYIQDFIIDRNNGILTSGCCGGELIFYPDSYFQNIFNRFKKGYIRMDYGISWINNFRLFNNFYLSLEPQIRFLSKIIKSSPEVGLFVPEGIIWAIGIQTGINYHF